MTAREKLHPTPHPALSRRERVFLAACEISEHSTLDDVRLFLEHSMEGRTLSLRVVSKAPGHSTETPNRRNNRRAVHPTKRMLGQVTWLDRPLPPGEGRGEGLVLSTRSRSTSLIGGSVERRHEATADLRLGSRSIPAQITGAVERCANWTTLCSISPSPQPSPGGRGRSTRVTCRAFFYAERIARWLQTPSPTTGAALSNH
jgi:hypothetical protein